MTSERQRIQKKIDESLMALTMFIGNPKHGKESVTIAKTFHAVLSEIQDSIPKIVVETKQEEKKE